MEGEEVNTTHRWNVYCHETAKDGRKCSLYSGHLETTDNMHVEKHGKSRWLDGE